MLLIPRNRRLNAVIELRRGLPAELTPDLRRINCIAAVMALAVFDVADLLLPLAKRSENRTYDRYIRTLVMSADVVDLTLRPAPQDRVDGTAMIVDMQPVAHISSVTVDGQFLPMHGTNYHERDELLGELERTIVV